MKDFTYHVPTIIHFGRGKIACLGNEIKPYSDRVLLVYGGGSIKKNGVYDAVLSELNKNNIKVFELSGVDPNPRIESVREGAKICRENNIGAVLAVGGGSAMDCAKVIAGAASYDGDAWDLVMGRAAYGDVLPIFCVPTVSATGSEMDPTAVISNFEINEKRGTKNPAFRPIASILDPEYVFSVPPYHTAAGIADIMSHIIETYFSLDESAYASDRMCEALLKTCMHYGPIAVNTPNNYEARANIMWVSSLAINGLLTSGKANRWSVHGIEHMVNAYYDTTHGMGLAVITPNWMNYVLNERTLHRFVMFGVNVWGIDANLEPMKIAVEGIKKLREFFTSIGVPKNLREMGVENKHFDEMAKKAFGPDGLKTGFVPITPDDIRKILEMSY